LKINYKGRATHAKYNKSVYLKFGTYAGHLQQYRDYFKIDFIPTRVVYFDGLMAGSSCNSIGKDDGACTKLLNQTVKEYKITMGDARLPTADRVFTLDAQSFEQLAYDLSSEDPDLDHNKLNHAIEAMYRKERQMAEEAAKLKKLEGTYEIANDLNARCYFSINRIMIKEKRTEILASGIMDISAGRVSFGPHEWKVRGSVANEGFLANQSRLVVDTDFLLHGTFPLFHLFVDDGSPSHLPLNVRFKIDERNDQRNSGDLIKRTWFDINDGSNAMTGNFSFSCR